VINPKTSRLLNPATKGRRASRAFCVLSPWLDDANALRIPNVMAVSRAEDAQQFLVLELVASGPPARDFDKTGNVRLLEGEEDAEAAQAAEAAADITPKPLPNYDELSVASLRARLRNLDVTQLKQVADYERSHLARAEVIAMFERRTAKLELEAGA